MKKPLSLFTLLLFAVVSFAQNIEVQAPNLVSVDEQFNVTFVIEGTAPTDFQWSSGENFQLVWGPQKGSMTRHSNINGNVSNSTQTTYTYILLPKAEGKFNLPSARATVNGRNLHSPAHEIEVVSASSSTQSITSARRYGSSQNSQSSSGGSSQRGSRSSGGSGSTGNESGSTAGSSTSVSNDDIYLRLELSKTNALVGETITATLKLYQRVNIVGFENIKLPTFNGFWSQEKRSPTTLEFHRENVNGKIYNVAVVRSWSLVPQRAGKLVIEPTEMVSVVNMRVNRSSSSGSVFDEFFQSGYQRVRKRLSTGSVAINVENLPPGAPATFGGGVGDYRMSASLTRSDLSVNDAASLQIRITGSGNMALISAPEVNFPPDFEVYDVKVSDISGGKLFEYPFIPRSRGEFTIDPIYYSYYNIDSRSYVTMTTDTLNVSVSRGSGSESDSSSGSGVSSVQRRDVKDVDSDIRFIEVKNPSFGNAGVFFVGSLAFWLIILGMCVLSVFIYYLTKVQRKRKADVVRIKTMGAVKLARKRLSIAEDFLRDRQYSAFYEELHKALIGYVADRFNMDIADMNRENICAEFEKRNVAEDVENKYIELIDACEYARYSPDSGEDMSVHYESAVEVISMLESNIRHNMKKGNNSTLPLVALLLLVMPQIVLASETEEIESKSASPVELWNSGVEAYQNGEWWEAIEAWNGIIEAGLISKELYYNLGNAYYKIQDVAQAVLCYERALKLNPSYEDARFNLQLTANMVQDKIEVVPEFFLGRWLRSLSWLLSSTTWALIGLILFALSLLCILTFLLASSRRKRIAGFFNGIVTFLLAIFIFSLAFHQKLDYLKNDSAVVVAAVSVVKSSPSDTSSKKLFVLHEGTKVKIINELGSWKNIEIADGRQGWMKDSDLELI